MCSGSVSRTCSTSVTQKRRSGSDSMCAWGCQVFKTYKQINIHDKISALSEIYLTKNIVPHFVMSRGELYTLPKVLSRAPNLCLFYMPCIILGDIRQFCMSCLGPLVFLLLNIFQLFDFPFFRHWAYLIEVNCWVALNCNIIGRTTLKGWKLKRPNIITNGIYDWWM
jgi:hypothetical protein